MGWEELVREISVRFDEKDDLFQAFNLKQLNWAKHASPELTYSLEEGFYRLRLARGLNIWTEEVGFFGLS